ncbi:MAG: pyruvate dehydrogenase complex dihydrolipoamide acetyltransferase [Verrucomicrobia bacterium]|nr:MAG: pyruvate dehydrogenase complex dihydrolipoamide acetyltransferase [Verrucomicrobiota bacterium]
MATIIEMPKLSDTMSVGTVINWLKKEGDKVSSGDKVAEIETDKATMEMEIFDDGVLLKQFVAEGEQAAVGDPLCAIGEPGEKVEIPEKKAPPPAESKEETGGDAATPAAEAQAPSAPTPAPAAATPPPPPPPAPAATPSAPAPAPAAPAGGRIKISPLARKLAAEKGIDPATVKGSGPGGRIVKADIEAAAAALASGAPLAAAPASAAAPAAAPAPAPAAPFVGTSEYGVQAEETIPVSNMRGTIARRLLESKTQIPHFYVEMEVDVGPMLALRKQINQSFGEGTKISVNDMILKACAHALRKVPAVNRSWEGDKIRAHAAAHVSFAVAIEDGLITPVIFNAHAKSLFQISREAKELGAKAKARKLQPNEFTGGTFCVSNLGMFGVSRFSAIINPPNAAILAVGGTETKPVVNEAGEIVVGHRLALTLSCDHRVVDGATGAQFLAALKEIIEKPLLILG